MIFRHIRLRNWRNFRQVDVDLVPRVFIVGANATGKSNFLDVFRFLRDIVKPGGGFETAVHNIRGGVGKLKFLNARRESIRIEVEIGKANLEKNDPPWNYVISFGQDNNRRPIIKEEILKKGNRFLFKRPKEEEIKDDELLRQTWLEQSTQNKRFRELVEFFKTVQYLHIVPQLIREPDRVIPRDRDPFGSDFIKRIAKTNKKTLTSRLRKIEAALRTVVPQFEDLTLETDDITGEKHLQVKYRHWRTHGAHQREDQFSDGTLRLIGFLWAVMDGQGPLLLEEPELSLHTAIVRRLAALLYKAQRVGGKSPRQVIVSTHSFDLLDDPGIGGEEVLVLKPTDNGTDIETGKENAVIRSLLEGGITAANAVLPQTEPEILQQETLFDCFN
ncbi:MAG: AAA family ATPase [Candidatus Zixiibacteriota bacterium]|jgi:predicted ATPase